MINIKKIQLNLNHKFQNDNLLIDALTHTSFLNRKKEIKFERLEFLGDRVLGLAISDILYEVFPNESEGDLAKRFAVLVSGKILAEIAVKIELQDFILVAENLSFSDGENIWNELILNYNSPPQDPKSELQELAMAKKYSMPLYSDYSKEGPDHAPVYKVLVSINNIGNCYGKGFSKKEAERIAAISLLKKIESM